MRNFGNKRAYLLYLLRKTMRRRLIQMSVVSDSLVVNIYILYTIFIKNFLATCPSNPGLIEW